MDVMRDLQDHQLVDHEGNACGRVDDTVLRWDEHGGQLGPLLSGGAVLLDELGRLGRILRPLLRFSGARRQVSIDWALVSQLEHSAIHVIAARASLGLSPPSRT
jgi:sporulation protein YlmC with PRC-barrel domain